MPESSYARLWCAIVDNLLIEEGEKGRGVGGEWRNGKEGEEGGGRGGRGMKGKEGEGGGKEGGGGGRGLSSMFDVCLDGGHGCSGADIRGM